MATLPTLTVTDAQAARIVAAFTDPSGTLTPAQNYKKWLKETIIDLVTEYEAAQYDLEYMEERKTRKQAVVNDLSTAT